MKAREMFEALGYTLNEKANVHRPLNMPYIVAQYVIKGLVHSERDRITFYADETYMVSSEVTLDFHKAITQQMKELGWLS